MIRHVILISSIFLLSFFVENSSSQCLVDIKQVEEAKSYSQFETQLKHLNSCTKLMYVDVLRISNDLSIEETQEYEGKSWEDIKIIINLDNESDSTKENRNK